MHLPTYISISSQAAMLGPNLCVTVKKLHYCKIYNSQVITDIYILYSYIDWLASRLGVYKCKVTVQQ